MELVSRCRRRLDHRDNNVDDSVSNDATLETMAFGGEIVYCVCVTTLDASGGGLSRAACARRLGDVTEIVLAAERD